ncbi:hypothetical protein [Oceanisphaera pacifica]|uniref:Uncharacterized protein n=1 Tax=Oceanisphaera pacifica TaxID=2818389 RepID=A0ABS3NEX7_9GAMM|nr:hypothetical protein [Oceanisphaera pacifica]MBO1518836.1 hypothetical protein [Oceanisphaera pacifica]
MHKSLQEQQQLLQLQAEALRLKLLTNQIRRKQQQSGSDFFSIAQQLPKAGIVWRLANTPRKLRNKLLIGTGLLALLYFKL